MRILHAFKVYRPDSEGGVPEIMGLLARPQNPNDSSSILVARSFGRGADFDVNGVPVQAVFSLGNLFSMPIAPTFPFALARQARRAEVVVLHVPFPLNDVGAFRIPPHVGVVVHWHSDIIGRRFLLPLLAPLIHNTLSRADRIIVSNSSIISLSPFLRSHSAKCVVIPFGTDPDYWRSLNQEEQAEIDRIRARHPRLVVATGRLVPYKGFDVLVRALQRSDATAIIVGAGPQARPLRRLAKQLDLADRIIFAGNIPRARLKLLLHAAQVFAFPSTTSAETFGIAQLEAMAVGVPIVNTALPTGVSSVARHECEALTVPPNDPSALAAAIRRLLDDRELARQLSMAGRRRVREEFDQETFITRVLALYEEVHARRSR
jgi:glycosyltransferase involved in cell wall biosynthesis